MPLNLYMADVPPSGDLDEWDHDLTAPEVLLRIREAIKATEPGETLHIAIHADAR